MLPCEECDELFVQLSKFLSEAVHATQAHLMQTTKFVLADTCTGGLNAQSATILTNYNEADARPSIHDFDKEFDHLMALLECNSKPLYFDWR